ncbi:MAG: serine/threonine-protein kinase [Rubripirellula sp.]|nr:serine/threonine-protein kinase [Rubripirellula sp.]
MTLLLDKLKVGGNATAKTPDLKGAMADVSHYSVLSVAEQGPQRLSAGDEVLQETQLLNGTPNSQVMTYTYPPGSTPLAPYTIRRGVGLGGFGEVYFAVSQAGKEVALKRIQRNLEVELRGVSHCLNLKHPNLVSLFDVCEDEKGQSWVVMEYVAGLNLRQILDQAPDGLPEEEARRWFSGIAAGVNHLHSAGLVHRDLKPGNIFDDLGIVKVGDYGLSKFISASHRGGHTESVGTFHYMAPEIGRGQYGREIDVYALGVILYELLTGRVPFDGESCHEIIVKHLTAKADLRDVRQPYRSVIAKCLAKDPAERFSNVSELLAALGIKGSSMLGHTEGIPVAEVVETEEPLEAILVDERSPRDVASSSSQPVSGSAARTSHEEPIARAVKQSLGDLDRWWMTLDRSPGLKVIVVIAAITIGLMNTHWLLPLLAFLAVIYVPYYIVRQMSLLGRKQPTYAEAQRVATATRVSARPITRQQWRSSIRNELRTKRSLVRVAELNTSWIAATCTTAGLGLAAAMIGLQNETIDAMTIAPFGWVTLVVLASSLGMLAIGKLWEREDGEGLPRRFVLAGVGAGVGAVAYALSQFLMLPLGQGLVRDVDATQLPNALYRDGAPVASGMMAHFALLFAMLRWWKSVDPLRRTRLSLWSITVVVVAEWVVHQFIPIPQPAGMLVAGGTAIVVQLSAPWINPRVPREKSLNSVAGSPIV